MSSTTLEAEIDRLVADGLSRTLAEMFALGKPPGCKTDREFLRGHVNGNQFADNPGMGDYYRKVAESRGADVTGKVYLSGLAAYPGDPQAWVADRSDVRRVCEERGWNCSGAVNVKGPPVEADPMESRVPVADDIVQEGVERLLAQDPGLANKPARELKEQVIDKLKGPD